MSLREHAICLARKGLRVFPLQAGGTKPVVKFSTHSTSNVDKVQRWWRTERSARNIGVHTGEGLLVLDVDVQSGGLDSLDSLVQEHGALPDTYKVSTPSGGAHYYFLTEKDVRNSASKIAPGIDIRGHNGYVVGAGSIRVGSSGKPGGEYVVTNDLPIAACPAWLEEASLAPTVQTERLNGGAVDLPLGPIPVGTRNTQLFKEACGLRGRGRHHSEILAYLIERNADAEMPLGEKEIEQVAKQASKYDPNPDAEHLYSGKDSPTKINPQPFDTFSAEELASEALPPINYIVKPILSQGVFLLVGRPKGGKSWLAMEVIAAVAEGTPLWNRFEVEQGDVLYLALEDGKQRLQKRQRFWENLKSARYCLMARRLEEGFLEDVELWAKTVPNPRLVVVDILARISPEKKRDEALYKFEYRIIAALQSLAQRLGICILLVHHERKLKAENVGDMVSGSNGLLGAADGIWSLSSPDHGRTGRLVIIGRDVEGDDFDLSRSAKPSGRWNYVGVHTDVGRQANVSSRIHAFVEENPGSSSKDIQAGVAADGSYIRLKLAELVRDGILTKDDSKPALYSPVEFTVPTTT